MTVADSMVAHSGEPRMGGKKRDLDLILMRWEWEKAGLNFHLDSRGPKAIVAKSKTFVPGPS